MDDPIVDDAGHGEGGGGEAAGAAVEAIEAEVPIFAEDLDNLTLEQLRNAFEERPELVRATDAANGWTLLHHAVHRGWGRDIVEYLLEVGPDAVRTRARNNGPLPIHLVNRRTDPFVVYCVAHQWPEALYLSYETLHDEGDVPFFCAIKNGALVDVVVIMFLLRYEPEFAAAGPGLLRSVLFSAVVLGELFNAIDEHHLREFSRELTALDGERALLLALEAHTSAPVVRFLQWAWPASIQALYEDGRNPLHFALLHGALHEVVVVLLKWRPAAVLEEDDQGDLPIHYARSFTTRWPDRDVPAWPDAAQTLVMLFPESLQQTNNAGEIPLHGAAESNSLPLVEFFVEIYPAGLSHKSNLGLLPIHKAAQAALPDGDPVVSYLVQQCPESVRERTNDGRTVLHHAVHGRGGPGVINTILFGNHTLTNARATDGALALHDAATSFQDMATVRALIQVMDPEAIRATMNEGRTPLHLVAKHPDGNLAVSLARFLIEVAPDLVRSQTMQGWIPLHCAAEEGPLELVDVLVEEWPASISSVGSDERTPLHFASASQPPGVVRYLANRWPHALVMASRFGTLPLHVAAKYQSSLPTVQALVELRPDSVATSTTDGCGNLPLHIAVAREGPPLEVVEYLVGHSPFTLQVPNADGYRPVEVAALCDAPLDVLFVLVKKWPECLLPRRTFVVGEGGLAV